MTASVALSKVAEINPRTPTGDLLSTDALDFFPMAAVDADKTVAQASERRVLEQVSKGFTSFRDKDVLLAKITPCFENGKIAQAVVTTAVAFGSTEFHVVRCNSELDGRYLVHFLRRQEVRADGQRKMTGSAGQRRVPRHFLESLEIPLPSIPEQRRIAAILDKADALRAKRREALLHLDRLEQAIFEETMNQSDELLMRTSIEDCMAEIIDYRGKTPEKTESGIPLITAKVVKKGELLEPTEFIAEEGYDTWMRRGLPQEGDVLFTTEAPLGEVAQLDGRKVALAQRLLLLRGKPEVIHNRFLMFVLASAEVRRQIASRATGSTVKGIRQSELRQVILPIPPLEVQTRFSERIARVQGIRQSGRRSLARVEQLFEVLQHRAFQGQL